MKSTGERADSLMGGVGREVREVRGAGRRAGRGFSMIELLIALSISSMLLSACLVALDASFKSYETTAETASSNVVSRLVMHRVLAMIRQGEEFGPQPIGIVRRTRLAPGNAIEFVSFRDEETNQRHVTRLDIIDDPELGAGMKSLRYRRVEFTGDAMTGEVQYPLLRGLSAGSFVLEFDPGPRLVRATIDLTVQINDAQAAKLSSGLDAPVLRLVSTTSPRRLATE